MTSQPVVPEISRATVRFEKPRSIFFLLLATFVLATHWRSLSNLITFSFAYDQYSYIILIPVVSVALVVHERAAIFRDVRWAAMPGLALIGVGLAGAVLSPLIWRVNTLSFLSATAGCLWALLVGLFALCYGTRAVRAALFPILFLALMVPVPEGLLDGASLLLQKASCQLTYLLMTLAGTPVLRSGFVLSTPLGAIEVADQCSGIRSTLGLVIGGVVAGHLFLRSAWKKILLASSVIPVSIFKNALRIVTLYWLGVHTDQRFLTGELHRRGGMPFSALAVGLMAPSLYLLYKSDVSVNRSGSSGRTDSRESLEDASLEPGA